jgi:hypothetical protein
MFVIGSNRCIALSLLRFDRFSRVRLPVRLGINFKRIPIDWRLFADHALRVAQHSYAAFSAGSMAAMVRRVLGPKATPAPISEKQEAVS